MMTWLSILKIALSLFNKLAGLIKDRRLLKAGGAEERLRALEAKDAKVKKSRAARRGADPDPERDDGFRRD